MASSGTGNIHRPSPPFRYWFSTFGSSIYLINSLASWTFFAPFGIVGPRTPTCAGTSCRRCRGAVPWSRCRGYCGAQDTFYVGTLKGVGRVYQQTFIDTYAKLAFAKLYDRKTPITAAEILNDRVVPFYDEHRIRLSRVLTDRGTEFCGTSQAHEYELYLAVEDIDHSRTKARSPQTNGICERFHITVLQEFYQVAFRKRIYISIEQLQADLDAWITGYNEQRPHQGRWCYGKTPMQTFLDTIPLAREKSLAA